jgi:hypothetical protein
MAIPPYSQHIAGGIFLLPWSGAQVDREKGSSGHEPMLHSNTVAFLIRCAAWVLLAWLAWSHPVVRQRAIDFRSAWGGAWSVEAPGDCDARAYGLLFRRACEE